MLATVRCKTLRRVSLARALLAVQRPTHISSLEPKMEAPQEITVELMERILREVEKDSTITVLPSLSIDELNMDFHGGSCMSRVTVRYTKGENRALHTLSMVVKVIPKIASLTETVKSSSLFPREIQMFDKILPRISHLLNRTIPNDHKEFFARGYYSQKYPSYLIAIEDLAPKGYKSPRRKNGLDLRHCQLALKTLARFHASSVMIRNEDKSLFEVFDEYEFQEEAMLKPTMDLCSRVCAIVSKAVESWPEFGPRWADRIRNRYKTLREDLPKIWKRDDSSFNVLNHGDFGLHNLMFRHSETGEVEGIMFVDFQCCSYNSPVLDLHQLIFSSATDEVRASHIETLLRAYHGELVATLESLGAPTEQTISYSQLLEEFENRMLFALFYIVYLVPAQRFEPIDGVFPEDLFDINNDDVDKYMFLVSESYAKTLKRLLPVFSQKNLI